MTDTTNRARQSGGQPIGGQFATEAKDTDTGVTLDVESTDTDKPMLSDDAARTLRHGLLDRARQRASAQWWSVDDGADEDRRAYIDRVERAKETDTIDAARDIADDPDTVMLDIDVDDRTRWMLDSVPMVAPDEEYEGDRWTMSSTAARQVLDAHERIETRPYVRDADGTPRVAAPERHGVCRSLGRTQLASRPEAFEGAVTRRGGMVEVESDYGCWWRDDDPAVDSVEAFLADADRWQFAPKDLTPQD